MFIERRSGSTLCLSSNQDNDSLYKQLSSNNEASSPQANVPLGSIGGGYKFMRSLTLKSKAVYEGQEAESIIRRAATEGNPRRQNETSLAERFVAMEIHNSSSGKHNFPVPHRVFEVLPPIDDVPEECGLESQLETAHATRRGDSKTNNMSSSDRLSSKWMPNTPQESSSAIKYSSFELDSNQDLTEILLKNSDFAEFCKKHSEGTNNSQRARTYSEFWLE